MALTINTNIRNDTDGYLLDAKNVKGGYIVVDNTMARDALPAATAVEGTVCYVKSDSKSYRKSSTGWAEIVYGSVTDVTVDDVSVVTDKVAKITSYNDTQIKQDISGIQEKIPSEATASNQLADKTFVNSSISTATATFKGTFTDLDQLKATAADANDYAFYSHKDAAGNSVYDRYKYSTTWTFEYTLNNSSFTADQWASINSGIVKDGWVDKTSAQEIAGQKDFTTLPRYKNGTTYKTVATTTDINNATLTIQKNGTDVQTFTANASSNVTANIEVPTTLSALGDDTTHRVVTDTQITTWNRGPAYPVETTLTKWNVEVRAGSITPAITLPSPTNTVSEEIRYTFTAATTSASFTAPSNYILGGDDGFAGLSAANTVTLDDLTAGSIYECSFAVIDSTHIGFVKKEWTVA